MRKARESLMALVFGRLLLALIFAFCAVAAIAPKSAPAAEVRVSVDEAKLIKLPENVATIVVGNPLIADGSLQPGGIMVVTGKGYGITNLMALDRAGAVLMERSIEVRGPREHTVVVYRGALRETYSCAPYCDPRITLGDANVFFNATINQTATRNSFAQIPPPTR
jgi:Pilus formation protein N terminal region